MHANGKKTALKVLFDTDGVQILRIDGAEKQKENKTGKPTLQDLFIDCDGLNADLLFGQERKEWDAIEPAGLELFDR